MSTPGVTTNHWFHPASSTPIAIRAYVIGQYARFIRPGWVRIGATRAPASGVTVSAYKDPSTGRFAIVATNQNTAGMDVRFSLDGVAASSVTPYETSAVLRLQAQTAISVSGGVFGASLEAQSVTTFVGTAE
jgi:glucuronoarabinoxylan endo-1,4-beta-xylanase